MCASIVTGVDAPPVLEPAERIFDLVPFAIENAVMFDRLCAVGLRWDAGRDTPDRERLAEPVGGVALVPEPLRPGRQRIDHQRGPLLIADPPCAQPQDHWTTLPIP